MKFQASQIQFVSASSALQSPTAEIPAPPEEGSP